MNDKTVQYVHTWGKGERERKIDALLVNTCKVLFPCAIEEVGQWVYSETGFVFPF